ncbi:hypothetical protein [Paenibacillus sp. KS-LC4]|uniref:hypothetical protein n=1 Tax=Paenibacillus sp. KS-LC4 TaxID=2979727 RepID=UPI0030D4A0A1
MRQKLLSIMFGMILLCVLIAPIASANSSSFSFDLTFRVVDGAANGKYHKLSKGNLSISGTVTPYDNPNGAPAKINQISIAVYKKSGTYVGTANVTPVAKLNTSTSFSQSLGTQSAETEYYLFISRLEDDGWDLSGQGTLVTN